MPLSSRFVAPESRTAEQDGLPIHWLSCPAEGTPTLYVHGVPNAGAMWRPFLELTGGVAVDLPGFGRSGKPAHFDYSIRGYDSFLERFLDQIEIGAFNLVVHDWGAAALVPAQRLAERIQKLVILDGVPLLSGYRWHRLARAWRTPVLGEILMGSTTRTALRFLSREGTPTPGPMPDQMIDEILEHFDHGTQRAILKLYRSADPEVLAAAGADLRGIRAPALVLWGAADPYIPPAFAAQYAQALGGSVELDVLSGAGHWPWLERPETIERVARFLRE